MRRGSRIAALAVSFALFAIGVAEGCGGDDGPMAPFVDGGSEGSGTLDAALADATVNDSGSPEASKGDAPASQDATLGGDAVADADAEADADEATDASVDVSDGACTEAGQPCTYAGTRALCNDALTCAPCRDYYADAGYNDDPTCASAYGDPELCLAGVCTPGECRGQADCVLDLGLPYCGNNRFCGTCAYDTQCPGPAHFCNYIEPDGGTFKGGRCVTGDAGAPCANVPDDSPCPANGGDVCCGGVARPGNCCSTAFCQASFGAQFSCVSNVCTTCPAPNGTDFYVDPVNGDDTLGTGALGGSSPCAFKTITRALTMIPVPAAPGTRIVVLGPATFGTAETLPLNLLTNIVLTSQGGPVTLVADYYSFADYAVALKGPGAGIQGGAGAPLSIAGNATVGTLSTPNEGVFVDRGTDDTTFVENVTVHDFSGGGIAVAPNGRVTIRQGVVSTGAQYIGLLVEGHATVDVPAGQTPTSFSANGILDDRLGAPRMAGRGIWLTARGAIDLHGIPGAAPGTGTVLTNGNAEAGMVCYRYGSAPPLPSTVDGLVSYGNGPGYPQVPLGPSGGIAIYGGANVKVRNSVLLGNEYHGVILVPTDFPVPAAGTLNDDMSHVDLGTTATLDGGGTDWGRNTLQAPADAGNAWAGICLALDPSSGSLAAAGNVFSGRDCSGASPGMITAARGGCAGRVDVGFGTYVPDAAAYEAGGGWAGNDIDVSSCTK
jgi:hypothetical protein